MSRIYTASFKDVSVSAAQDLFEILAPATCIILIHQWTVTQKTAVSDVAEEMLKLTTNRGIGSVTSGSGGTSATIRKREAGDAASSATVEVNNTTRMVVGSGTLDTDLENYDWNVRMPFQWIYTPELRPVISPGNRWTLELETAPASALVTSGTVVFEEIG